MKSTSRKILHFSLFLTAFLVHFAIAGKYQDLQASCKRGEKECPFGPLCFGFSGKDVDENDKCFSMTKIGTDSQCQLFVSVQKTGTGKYGVSLVGTKDGWVGLFISEVPDPFSSDQDIKVITCTNSKVEVKEIKAGEPPAEPKFVDSSKYSKIITSATTQAEDQRLICSFTLSSVAGVLELNEEFYIGIGGDLTSNTLSYPPKIMGSARKKMDFFKLLKEESERGGVARERNSGVFLVIMIVVGMSIVGFTV